MTQARTVKVRTALSRQLSQPGGRSLAEAERLADAALQTHRADAFAELGRLLAELETACMSRSEADQPRVYALAASIVDLAGFFDTGPFYDAAYSLCDLTDRTRERGLWSWDAIRVHVQTLRLLHLAGLGSPAPDAAALLAGLHRVVRSVLADQGDRREDP